jgi:hypothetical protein
MSKVENKPNIQTPPPQFEAAAQVNVEKAKEEFQPVTQTVETRNNRNERETYCSHEGIDRCRTSPTLLGAVTATVGDVIDIVDDDGEKKKGRVVDEDDDSYTVTYDSDGDGKHDRTVKRDKHTGECYGWRRATNEEIQMAAAMQEMQRTTELNSQRIDENIKTSNIEYNRKLENRKKELLLEDIKQTELGKIKKVTPDAQRVDYNDALNIRFQANLPDSEFESISVSEVILAQSHAEALKK